ncbi:MAG TPA: beta-eliminating lyase-related protein [Nocardioides sp.]|uniref:threonine aldolase family protein n=1 Tax=Nocardioides sp. TaxID=35761 RepID=UPI002E35F5B4|nr:beta-eliminating lyase-related protein [Nocardioides sp.]HEX5087887.1 beta-eliminating lyase-related protein [Nocardioides sp.]
MIELRSDNAAGVAPEILAAVEAANTGSALAYGGDDLTAHLQEVVRTVFEHPTARVFPVTSGTAANSLALSAATPPWGAVLCHPTAHIIGSEGGATSLFGGGVVMRGVDGAHALVEPARLRATLEQVRWGDPHESQPSVLSLTLPSDYGTVYLPEQVGELVSIAREFGLRAHLDGARIANAVAALGCAPADVTWRAGVDVLSLGATKNGALSAEAIVAFDDRIADELVYRTKRAGHVTSKMRFQSAQLTAYLTDGLWLRLAGHANERMAELVAELQSLSPYGVRLEERVDVNMAFVELPAPAIDVAAEAGLQFYRMGPSTVRLVTSWQTTVEDVKEACARLREAVLGADGSTG